MRSTARSYKPYLDIPRNGVYSHQHEQTPISPQHAKQTDESKPARREGRRSRTSSTPSFPDIERNSSTTPSTSKARLSCCNCDDPKVSNFFHYFSHKFHTLRLNKLITTCYKNADPDIFSKARRQARSAPHLQRRAYPRRPRSEPEPFGHAPARRRWRLPQR